MTAHTPPFTRWAKPPAHPLINTLLLAIGARAKISMAIKREAAGWFFGSHQGEAVTIPCSEVFQIETTVDPYRQVLTVSRWFAFSNGLRTGATVAGVDDAE